MTLTAELRAAVAAHGDALALDDGAWAPTYRELGARIDAMARALRAEGVATGDRVALLMARSSLASAAFHAILAARGVCVPLAPGGPAGRAATIVRDAGARIVLHDAAYARVAERIEGARALGAEALTSGGSASLEEPRSDDLAYLIYTSGSTGTPKGVAYDHGAAVLFPRWARERIGLSRGDRVAAVAPLHFDLGTFDLFAALSSGASVHVPPHEALLFPRALGSWLRERAITVMYAVPSLWTSLADKAGLAAGELASLRAMLFAGEVFPMPALARAAALAPSAVLENLYGPTETNVCTAYRLPRAPREDDPPLPIGEPLPFFDALVEDVDERGIGHLVIEGPGVMRGYWGAEPTSHPRRHATGDYVSREGAVLAFHGRRDRMVKLRGHRVELGEIEHAIAATGLVREVAVVVRGEGEQRELVAHYAADRDPGARALRAAVASALPAPMTPSAWIRHDALPRTSTGKIALPALGDADA